MPSQPTVSPRVARWFAIVIGGIGIAGIIVGSILEKTGLAITAGLLSAVSIGYLIVLTAVIGREAFERSAEDERPATVDETLAREVEERVTELVESGADEHKVRQLVTRALELGRDRRRVG